MECIRIMFFIRRSLLLIIFAGLLSSCAQTSDMGVRSLRNQVGDGIYKNYNDSLNHTKNLIDEDKVVGSKKKRIYDFTEPGTPIREPAKTRTFWIAPRAGEAFMTHGGWVTVLVRNEGWVGSPLKGRYLPQEQLVGSQKSFFRTSDKKSKGSK